MPFPLTLLGRQMRRLLPLNIRTAYQGKTLVASALWLVAMTSGAQTATLPAITTQASDVTAEQASSVLDAELMYLTLLGEMQIRSGEAGTGYSLILEAARKSGHPDLFRRAVAIALQSRSGEAALAAARSWAHAQKKSPEPLRVMLQVMLSLNQVESSANTLEELLDVTPDAERNDLIDLVGQTYARVSDREAALRVMGQAMRLWQRNSGTASSAWAALARVRIAAGQAAEGKFAAEQALSTEPSTPSAGLLAVELLEASPALEESKVQRFLAQFPSQHLTRMAYARYLLGANRWEDAEKQLSTLTVNQPSVPEPWLMLGALQLQNARIDEAETSLKRFLTLSSELDSERQDRGNAQAYISLSQIAEQRHQLQEAKEWLDKVAGTEDLLRIQVRRASLLAREGKLDEARALIRDTPERQPGDSKTKALAEAQLLKSAGQLGPAFELLSKAAELSPDDTDVLYEKAMLADKLGRFEDMERILRELIKSNPDNPHAYNALGYSMADRSDRLPEARALIVKALALAPGDPFITDSLGWVEFRMGNLTEAERILRQALDTRVDAEIATHLGEVLWSLGRQEEALTLFRQAKNLQPANDTLRETLRRLGISL